MEDRLAGGVAGACVLIGTRFYVVCLSVTTNYVENSLLRKN
jgi:hypothetical protein